MGWDERVGAGALGLCVSLLIGCQSFVAPQPTGPAVLGKVDYRELELLPTPAVLHVELVKTDLDGGQEELLGDWFQVNPGQVPIDFELLYDPARVEAEHDYVVRATITDQAGALFRTTRLYPVELWGEVVRISQAAVLEERVTLAEELRAGGPGTDVVRDPVAPLEPESEEDSPPGSGPAPEEAQEEATPQELAPAGAAELPANVQEPAAPQRDLLDVGKIVLTKVPRSQEVPIVLAPLPDEAFIRGRIHLPSQALLPDGSRVRVDLVAVSSQDPSEKILDTWERLDPGQPPIDFELAYVPADIDASDDHSVRVLVTRDDQRLFLTTALFAVDLSRELVHMRATPEGEEVPNSVDMGPVRLTAVPKPVVEEVPETEGQAPPEAFVRGRLDTADRRELPASAGVDLRLVARSKDDASEEVLARWAQDGQRTFPLNFRMAYATERIDQEHDYSVRCEVTDGGARLYLSTARYPVDLWADVQRMKRAEAAGDPPQAELDAGRVLLTTVPGSIPAPDVVPDATQGIIRGRVRYLENEVLPQSATLKIRVLGTSESDLTDEVLVELEKQNPGQVPIEFVLEYDTTKIDPALVYSIRAEILGEGERKLFMTTRLFPLELAGAEGEVDGGTVLLTRVPR